MVCDASPPVIHRSRWTSPCCPAPFPPTCTHGLQPCCAPQASPLHSPSPCAPCLCWTNRCEGRGRAWRQLSARTRCWCCRTSTRGEEGGAKAGAGAGAAGVAAAAGAAAAAGVALELALARAQVPCSHLPPQGHSWPPPTSRPSALQPAWTTRTLRAGAGAGSCSPGGRAKGRYLSFKYAACTFHTICPHAPMDGKAGSAVAPATPACTSAASHSFAVAPATPAPACRGSTLLLDPGCAYTVGLQLDPGSRLPTAVLSNGHAMWATVQVGAGKRGR